MIWIEASAMSSISYLHRMLTDQLKALRLEVEGVIQSLNQLAVKTGSTTITSTLKDILDRIHDPYMFVIVGEVKAGKTGTLKSLRIYPRT